MSGKTAGPRPSEVRHHVDDGCAAARNSSGGMSPGPARRMGRVWTRQPFRPSVASIERMPPWSLPALRSFSPVASPFRGRSGMDFAGAPDTRPDVRTDRAPTVDAAPQSLLGCSRDGDARVSVSCRTRQHPGFHRLPRVALYTTDAEGRLTYFNEAAVALWGRRPGLGELWCGSWRLFWLDGRPMAHAECPMAVALRENRAVRGATAIAERPDGSRVFFQPYPSPLRDPDGRLVGGVNVLIDVSDRQQAEQALEATTEALAVSSAARDDFPGSCRTNCARRSPRSMGTPGCCSIGSIGSRTRSATWSPTSRSIRSDFSRSSRTSCC